MRPPAIKGDFRPPTPRERRLYQLAVKVAQGSACQDRHGALIARGRRIVALTTNRLVSHPISDKWRKETIHAEQRALLRLNNYSRGGTMYCARDHQNQTSMPCAMCFSLLTESPLSAVVFFFRGRICVYDLH